MEGTEDWLEKCEDEEDDTDNGMRLVDLEMRLVCCSKRTMPWVTHVVHLVCNVHAQAEAYDEEKITQSLARSVEGDQSREAE